SGRAGKRGSRPRSRRVRCRSRSGRSARRSCQPRSSSLHEGGVVAPRSGTEQGDTKVEPTPGRVKEPGRPPEWAKGPAGRRLRVGFVVQGEGRGHMTQALALASFLRDAGHELARVWVGRSPWRSTPSYFLDGIGAPVETFDAPVQVPDRRGLGASP